MASLSDDDSGNGKKPSGKKDDASDDYSTRPTPNPAYFLNPSRRRHSEWRQLSNLGKVNEDGVAS